MSDTYTKVLLHFNGDNNAVYLDDFGSIKVWTAGGTAKVTTAEKKLGRSSLFLDGDTAYISTPDHSDFTLGSSNFSFDFWLNFPILPSITPQCIFCKYQDTSNRYYLEVYDNSGVITFRFRSREGAVLLNDVSFPLASLIIDTWYHFELTRSGGTTFYLFQNGSLVSSATGEVEISNTTGAFEIGRNGGSAYLNAYMDEFRYSYGIARHTTSFTPNTSGYKRVGVDDEYTSLLCHFSGVDGGNIAGGDSVGADFGADAGNMDYSTAKYKFPPAAAYNDNTDQLFLNTGYVGLRHKIFFRAYATIDTWVNFVDFTVKHVFYEATSAGVNILYDQTSAGVHKFSVGATALSLGADLSADTWYHIAFVKNGVTLSVYINGVFAVSADIASVITAVDTLAENASNTVRICSSFTTLSKAYWDEYRISIDIQRWTEDFIPSEYEYGTQHILLNLEDFLNLTDVLGEKHSDLFEDGFALTDILAELYPELAEDGFDLADIEGIAFLFMNEETVDLADAQVIQWLKTVDDTVNVAESFVIAWLKTLLDGIFIYDDAKPNWHKTVPELLDIADLATKILGFTTEEWLWLVDSQLNKWAGTREVNSNLNLLASVLAGGNADLFPVIAEYLWMVGATQNMWHGSESVNSGLGVFDTSIGTNTINKTIAEVLEATDTHSIQFLKSVLEYLNFDALLSLVAQYEILLAEGLDLQDGLDRGFERTIAEALSVVDATSVITTFFNTLLESLSAADVASWVKQIGLSATESLVFTETVASQGHLYSAIYEKLRLNVTVELDGETWECYVLNTPKFHPSMYSGFNFNSYCVFENRAFGANDTGIFELTGTTDAGATIHTGAILSETDFGSPNQKRFRRGYLGISGTAPVMVLETEDGRREAYAINSEGKVVYSSDLKSRSWKLSIADFEELSTVKLVPVILTK